MWSTNLPSWSHKLKKVTKKKSWKDYKMELLFFTVVSLFQLIWFGKIFFFTRESRTSCSLFLSKNNCTSKKNWTWIQTKYSTTKQGSSSPQLCTNFTHKLSDVVLKSTNSALYQLPKNPQCQARYKRNFWKVLSRI